MSDAVETRGGTVGIAVGPTRPDGARVLILSFHEHTGRFSMAELSPEQAVAVACQLLVRVGL